MENVPAASTSQGVVKQMTLEQMIETRGRYGFEDSSQTLRSGAEGAPKIEIGGWVVSSSPLKPDGAVQDLLTFSRDVAENRDPPVIKRITFQTAAMATVTLSNGSSSRIFIGAEKASVDSYLLDGIELTIERNSKGDPVRIAAASQHGAHARLFTGLLSGEPQYFSLEKQASTDVPLLKFHMMNAKDVTPTRSIGVDASGKPSVSELKMAERMQRTATRFGMDGVAATVFAAFSTDQQLRADDIEKRLKTLESGLAGLSKLSELKAAAQKGGLTYEQGKELAKVFRSDGNKTGLEMLKSIGFPIVSLNTRGISDQLASYRERVDLLALNVGVMEIEPYRWEWRPRSEIDNALASANLAADVRSLIDDHLPDWYQLMGSLDYAHPPAVFFMLPPDVRSIFVVEKSSALTQNDVHQQLLKELEGGGLQAGSPTWYNDSALSFPKGGLSLVRDTYFWVDFSFYEQLTRVVESGLLEVDGFPFNNTSLSGDRKRAYDDLKSLLVASKGVNPPTLDQIADALMNMTAAEIRSSLNGNSIYSKEVGQAYAKFLENGGVPAYDVFVRNKDTGELEKVSTNALPSDVKGGDGGLLSFKEAFVKPFVASLVENKWYPGAGQEPAANTRYELKDDNKQSFLTVIEGLMQSKGELQRNVEMTQIGAAQQQLQLRLQTLMQLMQDNMKMVTQVLRRG